MPTLHALDILRWLHFVLLAVFAGSAVSCLLLSGLEEDKAEFRGLAAALWAKLCRWGARGAVAAGIALVVVKQVNGLRPFAEPQFHAKLGVAILVLLLAETAPTSLARGRRGAAMLALVLFLVASFLALNPGLVHASRPAPPAVPQAARP